jgi:predicted nucleic acid-binding protein
MLVVDASVAAKWVFKEPNSDRALALVGSVAIVGAPSIIVAELGNIAWKRVRRGVWGAQDAPASVQFAVDLFTIIVPIEELWKDAVRLALRTDHPIYDCFYLALAQREQASFVTADTRLAQLAGQIGVSVEHL